MARIVLIGPPCSGKTTLGDELARITRLPHVVYSRVIAQAAALDAPLSHSLHFCHVVTRLRCPDCANGFILDNFPRTAQQARDLQVILRCDKGVLITHVFDLEVPVSVLEQRAASRLVDPTTSLSVCGTELQSQDPFDDAIVNGHFVEMSGREVLREVHLAEKKFVRRQDDAPDRVHLKLQRYAENITGIREFYWLEECETRYEAIDGSLPREEVLSRVLAVLCINQRGQAVKASERPEASCFACVSEVRTILARVEDRVCQVSTSMTDVRQAIQSEQNWTTSTHYPYGSSCTCNVVTRRYVGGNPGRLCAHCQELSSDTFQISQCLWQAREKYQKQHYGGERWYGLFVPLLFTACCQATPEIESLHERHRQAANEVFRLRNAAAVVCAESATRTIVSHCVAHQPRPEDDGGGS